MTNSSSTPSVHFRKLRSLCSPTTSKSTVHAQAPKFLLLHYHRTHSHIQALSHTPFPDTAVFHSHRPHVVQPVRKLDENHAWVVDHSQEHHPETIHIGAGQRAGRRVFLGRCPPMSPQKLHRNATRLKYVGINFFLGRQQTSSQNLHVHR
jgi:hypothetical protein